MAGKIITFIVVAFLVFVLWPEAELRHGPGRVAPNQPEQSSVNKPVFYHKGYKITPVANFSIQARVLSREDYYLDFGADIMPIDLALGWGPMSDETVLDRIKISQRNRFYYWYTEAFPIPRKQIVFNSANMHLIPANDYVSRQLRRVRKGHIVSFQGYLVNVEHSSRKTLKSSITRGDEGAGACEVIWVENLSFSDKPTTPVHSQ